MKYVRTRRHRPASIIKGATAILLLLTGFVVALSGLADAVIQLGRTLYWW